MILGHGMGGPRLRLGCLVWIALGLALAAWAAG